MPKPKFVTDREELEKLAPMLKAPINRQVFVCTGKSCSAVGGHDVMAVFDRALVEKGMRQGKESKGRNPLGEIVLTECGSIGFCSIGVAVMVYPDGTMYGQVQPGDVPEIVEKHLENGEVVERLALISLEDARASSSTWSITMGQYRSLLLHLLDRHPNPINGPDTLLYIFPPIEGFDKNSLQHQSLVYLLCLFTTADMKVHEVFPECSQEFKRIARIPRFEYGLTGTYYYPDAIFNFYDIPFQRDMLEGSFHVYLEHLRSVLLAASVPLSVDEFHRLISVDRDLDGIWGQNYRDFLQKRFAR